MPEPANYSDIRIEVEAPMAWLVLARPEKRNAISHRMLSELSDALYRLSEDDSIRVVAIRGEGPAFSAGFDVGKGSPTIQGAQQRDAMADWYDLRWRVEQFLKIWDLPKPVIASVHGACIGGATQLCAMCDVVVVAADASIGGVAIPLGAGYVSPLFAWTIGIRRAKALGLIPGERINGATAVEWGWATRCVPTVELVESTRKIAHQMARVPTEIAAANKLALNRVADLQGFRASVMQVADIDAIAHASSATRRVAEQVKQFGLRNAIDHYSSSTP
jgi:enoyl-CoA hydratase/carnithine racemase